MKYNYNSAFEFYNEKDINHYPILIGENIEGDIFETLDEWNKYPKKDEIIKDVMKFKSYLRTLKEKRHWSHPLPYGILGRIGNYINTPILNTGGLCDIDDFVQCYEETINGSSVGSIPKSLTDTDLGRNILEELKSTKFSSKYVFCHNALYYKSFVLKDNKLIGIRNWQYAGFYPPEFENIIAKYLDNIF